MPDLRVGLVGFGYWGPKLARCLHQLGALAAVADALPARQAAAHADYPYARVYARAEHLLSSDDLDAVCIATPISTHADLAERALAAGKHAFVEKPLCTESSIAADLVQMAEARGLVLMAGHTYLYHPAVARLAAAEIGAPYYAAAEWSNLGIVQRDLGVFWSVGPHPVSILVELFGPPADVRASGARCLGAVEDVAWLTLGWPGGFVAQLALSWLAPRKVRRLTLVGADGMAVFDEGAEDTLRIYDLAGPADRPRLDYAVRAERPAGEPLLAEVAHFLACCRGEAAPRSGGQHAVDVVRVLSAAQRSLDEGGASVEVEYEHRGESLSGAAHRNGLHPGSVQPDRVAVGS